MIIEKGLMMKGLLGLVGLASATTVGVVYKNDIYRFLSEKNVNGELNRKIKELGIDGCRLEKGKSNKECELTKEQLLKVKFEGHDGNTTLTGLDNNKKIKLIVEKDQEVTDFEDGLKFTFRNENDGDVVIGNNDSTKITLKKDIGQEFKIKKTENKLTLEKAWTAKSLGEKVGLTCTDNNSTTECTVKTGGVNVWKSENEYTVGSSVDSTNSSKKLTVAKDTAGYNQGFKFTASEDISLTGGTPKTGGSLITKLTKENTSYEIGLKDLEEGNKGWFLIEKTVVAQTQTVTNDNSDINEKIKKLGIEDANCHLQNNETSKECTVNESSLKKIKFVDKTDEAGFTVSGLDGEKTINLKIEKNQDVSDFPEQLKFVFKNTNTGDVKFGKTGSETTLKQNTNYDYKIKSDDEAKLEKAWSLKTLAEKAGLNCDSDSATECTLIDNKVNVWKENGDYITGSKGEKDKKLTITKDSENHNQGFKFEVKDNGDISLTEGSKSKDGGINKLTKENKSYEIDQGDVEGGKKWFLIEKSN